MMHPDTELRPAGVRVGYGVFATRRIPRGTITWVRDALDQSFGPEEVENFPPLHRMAVKRFSYREPGGAYVLCWDHARYSNHSCRPSCRTIGDFDIAVRDIEAGEELTIEYAVMNVKLPFACACGDPCCRGTIEPGDADRLAAEWDLESREAVELIGRVEQPLSSLFAGSAVLRRAVEAMQTGGGPEIPSCREFVLRC